MITLKVSLELSISFGNEAHPFMLYVPSVDKSAVVVKEWIFKPLAAIKGTISLTIAPPLI